MLTSWPATTSAHTAGASSLPPQLATAWTLDPLLLVPLALAVFVYLAGLWRYWSRVGLGRGVPPRRAAAHAAGFLTLFLALVWPLDAFGEWSLAAHMTQHMLLLAVAPPLLLLGQPGVIWLSAARTFWPRASKTVSRRAHRALKAKGVTAIASTTVAALLQTAVMWGWHAPAAMQLALTNDPVHYAMHASFFAAGLLFWWTLLRSLREPRSGFTSGLIAILGTMGQMGLLSALLTFSLKAQYVFYLDRSVALGLEPLEDQQLAGLIMWVPGAIPYLIGGLVLMGAWLSRLEQRERRRERSAGMGASPCRYEPPAAAAGKET